MSETRLIRTEAEIRRATERLTMIAVCDDDPRRALRAGEFGLALLWALGAPNVDSLEELLADPVATK